MSVDASDRIAAVPAGPEVSERRAKKELSGRPRSVRRTQGDLPPRRSSALRQIAVPITHVDYTTGTKEANAGWGPGKRDRGSELVMDRALEQRPMRARSTSPNRAKGLKNLASGVHVVVADGSNLSHSFSSRVAPAGWAISCALRAPETLQRPPCVVRVGSR